MSKKTKIDKIEHNNHILKITKAVWELMTENLTKSEIANMTLTCKIFSQYLKNNKIIKILYDRTYDIITNDYELMGKKLQENYKIKNYNRRKNMEKYEVNDGEYMYYVKIINKKIFYADKFNLFYLNRQTRQSVPLINNNEYYDKYLDNSVQFKGDISNNHICTIDNSIIRL